MESRAPYARIAADIRTRVERGELRPGDRVPSTRAITRHWGVAMATATKALAVLRDEGIVRTRPGAGTVVADPGPRPAPARRATREPELNRERIVRAAVALADAEGLAVVSMRRVAAELDVATMSLYRHVRSRDELTLQMVDAILAGDPLPPRGSRHWRACLELAARRMWTVLRRHPWAADVLSLARPQLAPNLLGYAEWTLSVLRELGFGVAEMMHLHLALFGHVRGTALSLQDALRTQQDTGLTVDEWVDTLDTPAAFESLPTLSYIAHRGFDYDLDAVFEDGLRTLLDGIGARLPSGGGERGSEQ